MILIVRLVDNQRCAGCGAPGFCCERTLLCLYCLALKVNYESRKRKLASTMAQRFAYLKGKIQRQLKEFRA
jgi:hypothetical protein